MSCLCILSFSLSAQPAQPAGYSIWVWQWSLKGRVKINVFLSTCCILIGKTFVSRWLTPVAIQQRQVCVPSTICNESNTLSNHCNAFQIHNVDSDLIFCKQKQAASRSLLFCGVYRQQKPTVVLNPKIFFVTFIYAFRYSCISNLCIKIPTVDKIPHLLITMADPINTIQIKHIFSHEFWLTQNSLWYVQKIIYSTYDYFKLKKNTETVLVLVLVTCQKQKKKCQEGFIMINTERWWERVYMATIITIQLYEGHYPQAPTIKRCWL